MIIRGISHQEIQRFADLDGAIENGEKHLNFLQESLERGETRLSWCFVAEENGVFKARLAYFSFSPPPFELEIYLLQLPWEGNYADVGKSLINKSLESFSRKEVSLVECRIFPGSTPCFEERKAVLERTGFALLQEKVRYIFADGVLPPWETRLTFRTIEETGEDEFIRAVELVTRETLDRSFMEPVERVGTKEAARNYFLTLKNIEFDPDLWCLGYDETGTLGGLVISQRLGKEEGAINYIGVAPHLRGKRYGRDFLIKGTAMLMDRDIAKIIADIDVLNHPLEESLRWAGYQKECNFLVYERLML